LENEKPGAPGFFSARINAIVVDCKNGKELRVSPFLPSGAHQQANDFLNIFAIDFLF